LTSSGPATFSFSYGLPATRRAIALPLTLGFEQDLEQVAADALVAVDAAVLVGDVQEPVGPADAGDVRRPHLRPRERDRLAGVGLLEDALRVGAEQRVHRVGLRPVVQRRQPQVFLRLDERAPVGRIGAPHVA
jgi:hypothetical protein